MPDRLVGGGRNAGKVAQSEREFQAAVIELATACGWRHYHTHDSRHSAAGFPDLVLVRRGVLIFAELKAENGKVTPEQQAWIDALDQVDADEGKMWALVWRPSDWPAIEAALTMLDFRGCG